MCKCIISCHKFFGIITGTTKIMNLDQNISVLAVKLSEKDLQEICEAVPIDEVVGARNFDGRGHWTWKFANTPPKNF